MKKKVLTCLALVLIMASLLIGGVALMFILKICPPQGPWPMPPWCSSLLETVETESGSSQETSEETSEPFPEWVPPSTKVDIYNKSCNFPYEDPDDEVMTPSVVGFGWNLHQEAWPIDHAHECGALFIAEVSMMNHDAWKQVADLPEALKEAYVKDLDGNVIYNQDLVFLDMMHPAYRQWLRDFIKNQIGLGADGFVFDEYLGAAAAVEVGSGLDENSLAGFPRYLQSHYSDEQLLNLGIKDIMSFNYKDYLIENNAIDVYKTDFRQAPLGEDYYQYLRNESNDFVEELIQLARSYAAQNGKEILISANYGPLYHTDQFSFANNLDYYTFEHTYLANPRMNSAGNIALPGGVPASPALRYAQGKGKYGVVLMNIYDYGELAKLGEKTGTMLTQHFFAEAYANQGYFLYFDMEMAFVGNQFVANHAAIRPYYAFLREHPEAFLGLVPLAEAAVIMPPHSTSTDYGPIDGSQGSAWILAEANIPYGVIDIGNLSPAYKVAIAHGYAWSDSELQKLLDFVQDGGVVLAFDSRFASQDEYFMPKSRPEISGLLTSGTHPLGNGQFIFFRENLAWLYSDRLDQKSAGLIRDTVLTAAQANAAPPNVQLVPYQGEDRMVVHLVNFDYQVGDFQKSEEFSVRIQIPDDFDPTRKTLSLISPDFQEVLPLTYTIEDGFLITTVPQLYLWDVLILE